MWVQKICRLMMAVRVVSQSDESQWGFGVEEAIRILNNIIFRKTKLYTVVVFFFLI